MSIYQFSAVDINGQPVSMDEFRGKVLLIVNTATGCGFTPQYEGLQKLYDTYREDGLEILDFPCNQFGHQAPGTEEEIASFCRLNYQVSFRQFAKIDVNGANQHPLFAYLKAQQGGLLSSSIKWNFTKFLVDRTGNVVDRFGSATSPAKIEDRIKALL